VDGRLNGPISAYRTARWEKLERMGETGYLSGPTPQAIWDTPSCTGAGASIPPKIEGDDKAVAAREKKDLPQSWRIS
jgi:hypothetical protein